MRVTAPRRTPMARARSAREGGWRRPAPRAARPPPLLESSHHHVQLVQSSGRHWPCSQSRRPAVVEPMEPSRSDPGPAVLVGAGDIGWCGLDGPDATARLLDGLEGTVFTAGDNAYPLGRPGGFRELLRAHADDQRPDTAIARQSRLRVTRRRADIEYFGDSAGPAGLGYYSFNLGARHIVSLNSNVSMSVGSPQEAWLRGSGCEPRRALWPISTTRSSI